MPTSAIACTTSGLTRSPGSGLRKDLHAVAG
jgi:hypothetical protein